MMEAAAYPLDYAGPVPAIHFKSYQDPNSKAVACGADRRATGGDVNSTLFIHEVDCKACKGTLRFLREVERMEQAEDVMMQSIAHDEAVKAVQDRFAKVLRRTAKHPPEDRLFPTEQDYCEALWREFIKTAEGWR